MLASGIRATAKMRANSFAEFWSETTILSPFCIFTPNTSQDIASAVKVLVQTNTKFAVRGGGHMPIPGAASTNDGILIAMDNISTLEVAQVGSQAVAKIGTGSRWINVYEQLASQKLTVIGGRYASVLCCPVVYLY